MSMQLDFSNEHVFGKPSVPFVTPEPPETATSVMQKRLSITLLQEKTGDTSEDPTLGNINEPSIVDKLHVTMSNIKMLTSLFSMYLSDEWRTKVLAQIADLLDADDWHDDDLPINLASFYTFLRTVVHFELEKRPGFGISNSGNLIAAWTNDKSRLILEFAPDDSIQWSLSFLFDGVIKRATGTASVSHLREVLDPYGLTFWISDDADTSS